jgi:hypothetical protein
LYVGECGQLPAETVAFRSRVIDELWDSQRWEDHGGRGVLLGSSGFRGACPECHGVLEVKFTPGEPLRAGARCLDNDCQIPDRAGMV